MQKNLRILTICAAITVSLCAAISPSQFPLVQTNESVAAQSIQYSCKLPPQGYDQERSNTAKGKVTEITYQSKATNSNRTALVYTRNMLCAISCTALTATAVTGWQAGRQSEYYAR